MPLADIHRPGRTDVPDGLIRDDFSTVLKAGAKAAAGSGRHSGVTDRTAPQIPTLITLSGARRGSGSSIRQSIDRQRQECRGRIDRHDRRSLARQTAPSRKVPGNQPILCRNIAEPRTGLKTLGHNLRLEIIRPTSPPGRTIRDLDLRDPRTSIRCSF